MQEACRLQERRQHPLDFAEPAARQQREDRPVPRFAERVARGSAIRLQRDRVGQRMADEHGIDPVARVDRRLHREQAEHAICAGGDLRRARFAPGPHRRAHVVHGAYAALLEPAFDAEVEVGRVDADEDVGLPVQHALAKRPAQLQETGQVGQHFGQAHHRQFARIEPGVHAGRAHRIAADAGEFRIGEMRA